MATHYLRFFLTGGLQVDTAPMGERLQQAYQEDPDAFGRQVYKALRNHPVYFVLNQAGERTFMVSSHVVAWEPRVTPAA